MQRETIMLAIGGAVALVAVAILARIDAAKAGQAAGSALVDGAAGVVIGIGSGMGIPSTDSLQCQNDLAAGRTWDASFSCPAGTFLKSWF